MNQDHPSACALIGSEASMESGLGPRSTKNKVPQYHCASVVSPAQLRATRSNGSQAVLAS